MPPEKPKIVIERLPECADAPALRPVLERVHGSPCHVTLDGHRVSNLPASGVEALLVLARTQRTRQHRFEFQNLSEAARETLALYGVTDDHLKGHS